MASRVFLTLIEAEIKKFVDSFSGESEKLFYDEEKKRLRHAGEFGMYREVLLKQFLKYFTPKSLDISSGFVITSADEVSTQCDLIVYDHVNTPLLQSDDRQKFFPIETVVAIGEVKSILSKADFKKAVAKLSAVKQLRTSTRKEGVIFRSKAGEINIANHPGDHLFTFLLCKKLDFDLNDISSLLNEAYEGIPVLHWYNVILSIEDGLFLYHDGIKLHSLPANSFNNEVPTPPIIPVLHNENTEDDQFANFKFFAQIYYLQTSNATIYYPEMLYYLY